MYFSVLYFSIFLLEIKFHIWQSKFYVFKSLCFSILFPVHLQIEYPFLFYYQIYWTFSLYLYFTIKPIPWVFHTWNCISYFWFSTEMFYSFFFISCKHVSFISWSIIMSIALKFFYLLISTSTSFQEQLFFLLALSPKWMIYTFLFLLLLNNFGSYPRHMGLTSWRLLILLHSRMQCWFACFSRLLWLNSNCMLCL